MSQTHTHTHTHTHKCTYSLHTGYVADQQGVVISAASVTEMASVHAVHYTSTTVLIVSESYCCRGRVLLCEVRMPLSIPL
jgi:hypothetical protein